jgi:hypothetical protein
MITLSTINSTGRDLDIGTIPAALSTVRVSMEYEQGAAKWDSPEAYLQYKKMPWSQPVVKFKPDSEKNVFTAENVCPGKYCLVLGQDKVTIQRLIEITDSTTDITVRIPKRTAVIRGSINSRTGEWKALWKDDGEIVGYINANENGNYELNNLPAGHYYLSSSMLTSSEILLELDLAEGEQKTLDIDASVSRKKRVAVLQVLFLDEYGVPVTDGNAWLQNNSGAIDPVISSTSPFYFEAEPGTYTLMAKFTGYQEIKQSVTVNSWDFQKMKSPPDPLLLWLAK